MNDKCRWCGDAPHPPGECKRDNCGEGEVCHSKALWSDYSMVKAPYLTTDVDPKTKKRVSRLATKDRTVTHIKPRQGGWRE